MKEVFGAGRFAACGQLALHAVKRRRKEEKKKRRKKRVLALATSSHAGAWRRSRLREEEKKSSGPRVRQHPRGARGSPRLKEEFRHWPLRGTRAACAARGEEMKRRKKRVLAAGDFVARWRLAALAVKRGRKEKLRTACA